MEKETERAKWKEKKIETMKKKEKTKTTRELKLIVIGMEELHEVMFNLHACSQSKWERKIHSYNGWRQHSQVEAKGSISSRNSILTWQLNGFNCFFFTFFHHFFDEKKRSATNRQRYKSTKSSYNLKILIFLQHKIAVNSICCRFFFNRFAPCFEFQSSASQNKVTKLTQRHRPPAHTHNNNVQKKRKTKLKVNGDCAMQNAHKIE